MNIRLPRALPALLLGCLTAAAQAERAPQLKTVNLAVEAPARSVVLPSGPDSALVTAPCAGCAPKSLRATATTGYFINERRVTVGELKAAVDAQPDALLTVLYSLKTGELLSVTAAVAPASPR